MTFTSCWRQWKGILLLPFFTLIRSDSAHSQPLNKELLGEHCYEVLHSREPVEETLRQGCRDRLKSLPSLMVTASRRREPLLSVPASVSVITAEEIDRQGFSSLAEALRDVPSVDITDGGQAGLQRIRIRGEESRRVAVMIDGQDFIDEREAGTPLLLAPEMIERIEVIRSTGSVLYGSRGIGGVVNFITRKGGYHPIQASLSSSVNSGTNGHQQFLSVHGKKEGFSYRAAGTIANDGDRRAADGPVENTAYKNDSILLYGAKEWENHKVALSFDNFNASSEVYVEPRVRSTPPFTDFRIDAPQRDRQKFALFYDGEELSEVVRQVHFDLFYQKSERQFNTFSELELRLPVGLVVRSSENYSDSTLGTIGGNGQVELELSETNTVIAGFEFAANNLDQQRRDGGSIAGRLVPEAVNFDSASQDTVEFFLQDEQELLAELFLTGGVRGYWLETSLDRTTRAQLSPFSSSDWHAVGAVGLKYKGIENMTLWGGWSQGFVAPSLVNLATGALAGPDFVNPNPGLQAERSNSFEIGSRYEKGDLRGDLALFYVDATDYIDHVPCPECQGSRDRRYVNLDAAKSFGLEATLRYTVSFLTPYTSLSYIRRRFERGEFATYSTRIPAFTNRTGVLAEREVAPKLTAWADLFVRTATGATEQSADRNSISYGGWGTLNLSLGARFGQKEQYRVAVDLINLGDKSYTPATENIPALGASAMARLSVDL